MAEQDLTRREPTDVSVEALDLADYAHTLRTQDVYSRFSRIPAPRSADSFRVPSLVSGGNTAATSPHSHSFALNPRRHYSLPDTTRIQSSRSVTQLSHGHATSPQEMEIDISQFPPWSRNWYETRQKNKLLEYDLDAPPPARISIFDPTFKANDHDPFPSYGSDMFPSHSTSTREYYLPWSSDPLEGGIPVNVETKEERIRMLEREFGQKAKPPPRDAFTDENGKPLVGTVDANGNLVTVGPKKRAAFRALQILLALVAAVPSIYAALFIKSTDGTPPPAGKLAAYVLYTLSVITTLFMLFLYVFRPYCCGRRKRQKLAGDNTLLNGMAVLPVHGLQGGKDRKKRKGKKGGNDVHVNLIVDPNAFGINDKDREADDEEELSSSDFDKSPRRGKRRNRARRSVFAGLAMEREWERARTWLKKMIAVDVLGVVVWGAAFVLILHGKRCPSGEYGGWCNAYNTSSAAACLLCLAFGVSIFFDVKDLYASKTNPRTRNDF
ncbi:hypothetical protein F5887DRAFT_876523 [Amanita rubescens]|nr:hypothetical protein F5887DRAFT_876523 [Amanita rubescens]